MRKRGMSLAEIDAGLALKGLNRHAVARALKVNPSSVGDVCKGKVTSSRIQLAVAEAMGRDVREVFATYDPSARPGRKPAIWVRQANAA